MWPGPPGPVFRGYIDSNCTVSFWLSKRRAVGSVSRKLVWPSWTLGLVREQFGDKEDLSEEAQTQRQGRGICRPQTCLAGADSCAAPLGAGALDDSGREAGGVQSVWAQRGNGRVCSGGGGSSREPSWDGGWAAKECSIMRGCAGGQRGPVEGSQ